MDNNLRKIIIVTLILFISLFLPLLTNATENPRLVLGPAGHTGLVREALFMENEKYVITCSEDRTIKIWDIKSGKSVNTFRGYRGDGYIGVYYAITADPKGRYLAAGGWFKGVNVGDIGMGAVRIFDLKRNRMVRLLKGHTSVILSLAYSPDGKYIASAGNDKTVRIWDTKKFQCVDTIQYHSNDIYGLSFSSNSRYIASASNDKSIAVYDIKQKKFRNTRQNAHDKAVMCIRFSPDNRYIATGSHDGTVKLWDAENLSFIKVIHRTNQFYTQELSFSPDSKYLLYGGNYREMRRGGVKFPVYVYNLNRNKIERVLRFNDQTLQSIHFSKSGKYLAVAGGSKNEVHIIDTKNYSLHRTFVGLGNAVFSVAVGKDSKTIFWGHSNNRSGNNNRTISKSISLEDFTVRKSSADDEYIRSYNNINGISIHYNWQQYNKTISIGNHSITLPVRYDTIHTFTLTPDGRTAIVGSDFGLYKIDINTGEIRGEFSGHTGSILSVSVTKDSRYMISGSSDQTIKIWDINNFKTKREFYPYNTLQDSWKRFARDKYPDINIRSQSGMEELYTRMMNDYPQYRKYALGLIRQRARSFPVATIFVGEQNRYLVWTPDYYYTGDKGLFKYIGWHINQGESRDAKFYPFEQFDLKYNRPDIILKRLGKTKKNIVDYFYSVYRNRVKKMGFLERDLSGELHAPEVSILTGGENYTKRIVTAGATASIKILGGDKKYTLDRINVYNNRVPVYGIKGLSIKSKRTKRIKKSLGIKLVPGLNRITVSVINSKGVESLKESIIVHCKKKFKEPTVYIATIGVSKYKNTLPTFISIDEFENDLMKYLRADHKRIIGSCYKINRSKNIYILSSRISPKKYHDAVKILEPLDFTYNLSYAHKDAIDLINIYRNNKAFKSVKVLNLNNKKAVRKNIKSINSFFKQTRVNDIAVLFIAGHGLRDSKLNYYFGTHNINFTDPSVRGYPFQELDSLFDKISSLNRVFFMDTCHSGELNESLVETVQKEKATGSRGRIKVRSFPVQRAQSKMKKVTINSRLLKRSIFANLRYGTGAVIITSSGSMEFSYEGVDNDGEEVNNGVFTYSLISGLRNYRSDINKDNKIQVSEIMKWTHDKVRSLTKGKQTPTLRRENLEIDYTIY